MYVVGLTGGIGAGKSTFASLLAERGAQIIDADELGRDALQPGKPSWHSVVAQFGDEILLPGTMEVDRAQLAEIVFNSKEKLAALNAIVHPAIMKGIADDLERLQGTDEIVVLDAALIVELGLAEVVDAVIVVTAPDDARRHRLMTERGMTSDAVAARIASQATTEQLLEKADIVVNNDGTRQRLAEEADRVWKLLHERVP
jgi:dephospho-CoA kinase